MTLDTGHDNTIMVDKILAISKYKSAPLVRKIKAAKEEDKLIDHTDNKAIKSVIFLVGGLLAVSSVRPDTLRKRLEKE